MTRIALCIQLYVAPDRDSVVRAQRPIVIKQNSGANETDCVAVAELAAELRQPLTAAGNYVGVARMLLDSAEPDLIQRTTENLEKAETQILRAGDIVRRLRRALTASGTDESTGVSRSTLQQSGQNGDSDRLSHSPHSQSAE